MRGTARVWYCSGLLGQLLLVWPTNSALRCVQLVLLRSCATCSKLLCSHTSPSPPPSRCAAGEGGGFQGVDLSDPRFGELLTSHHFALDPTDPRYK